MAKSGFGGKTTRSAAWLFGQRLLTNLIGLMAVAILARKLSPSDFGVVALAGTTLNFIIGYGSATVGTYVIYDRAEGREERVQAAFWLNLALVVVTTLLFLIALPYIVQFYAQPLLGQILIALMIRFALSQLAVVPDALIKRDLDYQKLVKRDSALLIISELLSVGMALAGFGVWSLVIPGILVTVPRFILVIFMARWVPRLPLRIHLWREIFQYIRYIMARVLLGMVTTDGDTLIIGKIASSQVLGLYDRAWRTSNLITKNIVSVVSELAMPSFSSLADRPEALRAGYLKMLRLLSIVSFPLLVGMFVLSREFILILYGPKWVEAILPLQFFLIYTIQRSVGSPAGVIFDVVGRPDVPMKINLYLLPFYFLSIYLGNFFGIAGIALAVSIVKTISGIVVIYLSGAWIGLSIKTTLKTMWPAFELSALMAILIGIVKSLVAVYVQPPAAVAFLAYTTLGGIIVLILLMVRYQAMLEDILSTSDALYQPLGKLLRLVLRHQKAAKVIQGN